LVTFLYLVQSALAPFVLFNDNRLNLMVSQDFRFLRKEEFHSLGISELLFVNPDNISIVL